MCERWWNAGSLSISVHGGGAELATPARSPAVHAPARPSAESQEMQSLAYRAVCVLRARWAAGEYDRLG
jgi:hypothetical protein